MTDIVNRLRVGIHTSVNPLALTNEAADRIEQLEAALLNIYDKWENGVGICDVIDAMAAARSALGEKKDG